MKKIISLIIILCLCTSLVFLTSCSSPNTEKNSGDDAMAMLDKSSKYYKSIKNVKLDSVIESVMIYNDIFMGEPVICGTTLDVTTVLHNEPFRFSSSVHSSYDDTIEDGGISYIMQNNTETAQHGVMGTEKMTVYQIVNEEWLKIDLAHDDFLLNDTLGLNYVTSYDRFVTNGKIIGNEKVDDVDAVKAEFNLNDDYAKIMYKKYGFEEFAKLADSSNVDKAILDMMKDAKFTVWFNEKNNEIAKLEVDLTSLMDTFRKLIIEDNKEHLSDEKYAYLNECADKISIKNTIRFSGVDSNESFELPQEAKEAKVYGQ